MIANWKASVEETQSNLNTLASNSDLVLVTAAINYPPPCYGVDKFGGYRIMPLSEYNIDKPYQPTWVTISPSCLQAFLAAQQNIVNTLQAAYDQCNCSACG